MAFDIGRTLSSRKPPTNSNLDAIGMELRDWGEWWFVHLHKCKVLKARSEERNQVSQTWKPRTDEPHYRLLGLD